jgi:hypothetical protein
MNDGIKFYGKIQPVRSRVPEKPMVNYSKGGNDFRTFKSSSFGKQVIGFKHLKTAPHVKFTQASRFEDLSNKPYPKYIAPESSLSKQTLSYRRNPSCTTLGTSTRASALKLYTIYNDK